MNAVSHFLPTSLVRNGIRRKASSLSSIISTRDISPVFFGTYQIKKEQVPLALKSAIQLGYRSFDCAPIYFNETEIGDALAYEFSKGSIDRKDLFIGSKLASPFHRNDHVKIGLQKTLTDLRLSYLDQFIIHWPTAFHYVEIDPLQRGYENEEIGESDKGKRIDATVSVHETWEAMEELLEEGLVRSIGVSNFTVSLLHELMTSCRISPALNQVECHPYLQQKKLLEYCKKRGVHVQAYSPLGSSGHIETGELKLLQDPVLKKIADNHQVTVAQVCIAWALLRGTSIVAKSTSRKRQKENMLLDVDDIVFSAQEMNAIDSLDRGYRFFRPEDWWGSVAMAVFD